MRAAGFPQAAALALLALSLIPFGACSRDGEPRNSAATGSPELAPAARTDLLAAIAAVRNGRPELALQHLQPWLDGPDTTPEHEFVAAQACYDLQRHVEAIERFTRAVAARPEFLATSSSLGFAHYKLGQFAEARACFRQIVEAEPGAYKAHYGLALVEFSEGHLAAAHAAVTAALDLQPDYLKALYLLGRIRQAEGHPGHALDLYTHVLERWPSHEEALYQLAQVQTQLGRHAEAEATLERRAAVYALKEALGALVLQVRAGQDSVAIRLQQVQLQEALGEHEEALRAARAGLAAFPEDRALAQAVARLTRQD